MWPPRTPWAHPAPLPGRPHPPRRHRAPHGATPHPTGGVRGAAKGCGAGGPGRAGRARAGPGGRAGRAAPSRVDRATPRRHPAPAGPPRTRPGRPRTPRRHRAPAWATAHPPGSTAHPTAPPRTPWGHAAPHRWGARCCEGVRSGPGGRGRAGGAGRAGPGRPGRGPGRAGRGRAAGPGGRAGPGGGRAAGRAGPGGATAEAEQARRVPPPAAGRGCGARRGRSDVVDARLAAAHVALVVELPQLVAVRAPPPTVDVAALVLEPDGDAVALERPQVLAQRVVELAVPLLLEERGDLGAAGEEPVAVAPDRVRRVRRRDPLGIAGVPRVLGGLHLRRGARDVERGKRGAGHGVGLSRGRVGQVGGSNRCDVSHRRRT